MRSRLVTRRAFVQSMGTVGAAASLPYWLQGRNEFAGSKPNIVLIWVDDLSWADVGAYGSRFCETPNLDRFAAQGMRFTDGYAPSPICSASRAAVLTGQSPARLHFEFVSKPRGWTHFENSKLVEPPVTADLPLEAITFAEALKPAGYRTGCVGKWHLTQSNDRYLGYGATHGPAQQGFDYAAEDRGAHPYTYEAQTFGDFADGEFPHDATTANAIRFLKADAKSPFLLYFSNYYPHRPVHTKCKWLYDKYKAKAQLMGIDSEKRIMYGAFVEMMDHYIGQFLKALDDLGLGENTIVFFTSDNGGNPEDTSNHPLRGNKWMLYEGGIREPFMVRWPGRIRTGSVSHEPVIATDLFPTFCDLAGIDPLGLGPLDGMSLLPLLQSPSSTLNREDLIWHFPNYHPPKGYAGTSPCSAIRHRDFKLIYTYEDERSELYNLAHDIGETRDLAQELPDMRTQLQTALFAYLSSVDARLPKIRGR